jgi:two-component system OmpR family sensor kinase
MIASLRGRLLATVLAVTAVGLLVLASITYVEQRSFLYQRADQQVKAARGPIQGYLAEQGVGPDRRHSGHFPDPDGDGDRGGPGGDVGIPPGTYGERRDAAGHVLGSRVVSYDESTTATPKVPADPPLNRIITVDGAKTSTHYRLLASRESFGGGTTIVAVPLNDVSETLHRLLLVLALVIAGVLLVLGLVAAAIVRVGLLPLDRMGHTAGAIAGGDLSHRVTDTDPRSEVGRLGIALNAMLDRLEEAFRQREASENRLRQFLADASHELRTPLASIRGYAELFRMGAVRDESETRRAMQRIEDESARMGVLVEDLLTLARLDEVADAPHAEVDLAPLVHDAADDARAIAPDREITALADDPVVVTGDAHQLRQVLANLVRNALVHTPAGSPVELTASRNGSRATLSVRDHGPGLPSGDPDALFERFWRAEAGRERGKAGAGLGLAIVAAIVEHHGGRVSASNATGGGAEFTVELPLA